MTIATAASLLLVATTSQAVGSEPAGITVSQETISQSMVAGSSATSLGNSPLAKTPAGKAAAADDGPGLTVSSETVVSYDPETGNVLSRHHYGPRFEGKMINPYPKTLNDHGTGGTSMASGCNRVTISMKRDTFLGTFAAKFAVWTDWCWTRSNQVVSINAYGRDDDLAPGYHYNGLAYPPEHYFYDFSTDDGHPKSAHHHEEEGLFSGPTGTFAGGAWDPQITLDAYYNGTNQWFTSD